MRTLSQEPGNKGGNGLWIKAFAVAMSVILFACVEPPQKAQIYHEATAESPTAPSQTPAGNDPTDATPVQDETDPWAVYEPAVIDRTTATDEFGRPVFGSVDPEDYAENEGDEEGTSDTVRAQTLPSPEAGRKVFSNKDLSRYSHLRDFGYDRAGNADRVGDQADGETSRADGAEGEEGAAGEAPAMTEQEWQASVQNAEAAIAGLEEKIQYLENRIPSLHNPLLPRAPVSQEDREAEQGMRQDVRLNKVKNDINESRQEIEKKKKELSQLQASKPKSESDSSDN